MALHLLGAPLLLWKRTRLATFCLYCLFHSANGAFFNIGIFPWLTIAATTIFFAPDWPRRVARWLLGQFEPLPAAAAQPAPAKPPLSHFALLGIALWLLVQIALPLRAGLFPTEVRWSGDGHRFSWRMRIYDRQADGVFVVSSGPAEWTIEPTDYLTPRQASKMMVRPDMVHQFAGHLGTIWRDAGYGDVSVRAKIEKSLNGRPGQTLVDSEFDLTAVTVERFGPDLWVLPLEEAVWGVRDNRRAASLGNEVAELESGADRR